LGAGIMTGVLFAGPWVATAYSALLILWIIMGFGYSLTITPAGRALRRSSNAADRPALFAAQFALSHACWLIAYPVSGFVSAKANPSAAFLVLAGLCAAGTLLGLLIWPVHDPLNLRHRHDNLTPSDPHLRNTEALDDASAHAHPFVIDERHTHWPKATE